MSRRIGLVSDVHASPAPLAAALDLLVAEGADELVCAGDIAGYGSELDATVALLEERRCRTVAGNHDRWQLARRDEALDNLTRAWLAALPTTLAIEHDGCRVDVVHASPPDSLMDGIRLLDESGAVDPAALRDWSARLAPHRLDVLVVGHTHQVFAERLGNTLVVNPGSTLFNRSCALLELPSRTTRLLALPGERLQRTWHWAGGWNPP